MSGALDPYLLPNGTLRNKLGITDQSKLSEAEADLAAIAEKEIRMHPPAPPFTFDTLRRVHRSLFGDVYDWAGELRLTELSKLDYEGPGGRATRFTPPNRIAADADRIFSALQREDLAQLTQAAFATRAAHLLIDINNLHWAREGNGRAQRLLLVAIGRSAGIEIAFDAATRERMVRCSVAGSRGDPRLMERLFHDICDPERTEALRAVLQGLRSAKQTGVPWNDLYIATTAAGHDYTGMFVAAARGKFMMKTPGRDAGDWIAVGDATDLPPNPVSGQQISFRATRFANPASTPNRARGRPSRSRQGGMEP